MARGRGQNLQGAGPGRNLIQPSIRTFGRGLYRGQQQAPAQAPVRELPDWDVDWEPPINNPPYRWSDDLNETAYAWGVHQNQTRRAEVLESVYGRMASLMINTGISMRKLINEMKDKMWNNVIWVVFWKLKYITILPLKFIIYSQWNIFIRKNFLFIGNGTQLYGFWKVNFA